MALRRTRRRSSPDLQLLGKQPEGDTKVKDEEKSLFEATENGVLQLGADKVREYLLATYDKVPAWLKDNPHIATGYRVHFSWRLCLRSMFRLHNETMNVWTHLIGFFIFFALLLSMSMTLSPYGYDYFHLDQRMKLSTEMITKYRQHFSAMVDSIQLRLPSWVEIYDRLSDLSREIGGHLNPQVNSTLMAYLDGFKEKLTAIKHAVGGVCETCSVADLDRMRQGLTESVDKIFDSLSSLPNFPAHAVDSAKHRLQEISYFLRSIRLEATPFSDFQTIFPDAIAFLPRWPLAVFISAAMSCLLFSATFHLFYCRSQQAYTLLQQLDYAGICILIAGSMVPAIYYGFYCSKFFRCLYMTMGVALPMIAFFLCMSKYLSGHQARRIRAAIFATAGLANLIPLFHMLMINAGEQRIMLLLSAGGVCYIIGAVFYSTQIPESIFPGKFDIWFHSHSIFHMFVVIAALMHYLALMRFFEWRMMNTCI